MKVRLTSELKDMIEEAAKANNRSMNAEIVARIERSFEKPESLENRVAELERTSGMQQHAITSSLLSRAALAAELGILLRHFEKAGIPDNVKNSKDLIRIKNLLENIPPEVDGIMDAFKTLVSLYPDQKSE